MQIEKFRITGFKSLDRHAEVIFSRENATVIYGENGCGKTTFLKAISSFLSQDDSSLISLGVQKIECTVSDNGESRVVTIQKQEDGYNWLDYENCFLGSSSSLSLGVERGISTQNIKIEAEALYEFFGNPRRWSEYFGETRNTYGETRSTFYRKKIGELAEDLSMFLRRRNAQLNRRARLEIDFSKHHLYLQSIKIENIEELLLQRYRIARFTATKKIQSALFDTLSVAIDTDKSSETLKFEPQENFANRLIENKDRIIEALDDGEENNFKYRIVAILNSIEDSSEMAKVLEHPILSQLFRNMIDELEVEKLVLSSINLLVEKFNNYLIENKKLVINGSEVYVDIEGSKHSVNDLSSGERHILTFLALVLFEGQNRSFLIIDEPEISLNIKWQREIISIFAELLPKTQIIVASHSPALAKRNPDYLAKLMVWRA